MRNILHQVLDILVLWAWNVVEHRIDIFVRLDLRASAPPPATHYHFNHCLGQSCWMTHTASIQSIYYLFCPYFRWSFFKWCKLTDSFEITPCYGGLVVGGRNIVATWRTRLRLRISTAGYEHAHVQPTPLKCPSHEGSRFPPNILHPETHRQTRSSQYSAPVSAAE